MINRNKKYKDASAKPYPSIGKMLAAHIETHKVNKAALARLLDISISVMNDYPKRNSLQMGIIWKLSLALQYNFLAELAEQLPVNFITKKEKALEEAIAEKDSQIASMQSEIEVYRRIVGR